MGWLTWVAGALGSTVPSEILQQLCQAPQEATVEIVPLQQITAIITRTYVAISRPVDKIAEPSTIIDERPTTIFDTVPGLSMHPLTFLLILTAIFLLLSFFLVGLLTYKSRSKHAHNHSSTFNTSQLAKFQANSKVREHHLRRKLRVTKMESDRTRTKITRNANSRVTKFKKAMSCFKQAIEELELLPPEILQLRSIAARSSSLKAELESLTSKNKSLRRSNDIAYAKLQDREQTQRDNERLNQQLQDMEKAKHEIKTLHEALKTRDEEFALLRVNTEALRQKEIKSLARFDESEKKCEVLQDSLNSARKEIREMRHEKARLSEQLHDFDNSNNEIEALSQAATRNDTEIASLQVDREVLEQDKISFLAKLDDSNNKCKDLQVSIGAAENKIQKLECDKERLNEQLNHKIDACDAAAMANDQEIVSLQVNKEAIEQDKISIISRLDDSNEKCKNLEASLTHAMKENEEVELDKKDLLEQVEESKKADYEDDADCAAAVVKDVGIPSLPTRVVRVGSLSERILQGQKYRLHCRSVRIEGKLQAKTDELSATKAELNDQRVKLATTNINYDFINERYEALKTDAEAPRSEVTTTHATMEEVTNAAENMRSDILIKHTIIEQAAKDADDLQATITVKNNIIQEFAKGMGIFYPNEVVLSQKAKVMDGKKISERKRNLMKMFDTGAASFKLTKDRRGRSHSITGCETRLEIAEGLPGRSKHLIDPRENEILDRNGREKSCETGMLSVPSFHEVVKALKSGRMPYTPEVVNHLIYDRPAAASNPGRLILTKTKEDLLDPVVDMEKGRAVSAAFWAANTKLIASTLLPHKLRKMEKEAAEAQNAAIGKLMRTYDNRLSNIINQLDNYRAILHDNDLTTKVASIKQCNLREKAFLQHMTDANTLNSNKTVDKLITELTLVNQRIHNRTLDSVIDGKQGLRSMISKGAKE